MNISIPQSLQNKLVAIAAMGERREIGKRNGLCFRDKQDMELFRALTTGAVVIMGRKTYDSIPNGLPNRNIIVLTRDEELLVDGHTESVTYVDTVEQAIETAKLLHDTDRPIYVAGGAEIYSAFSDKLSGLFLSYFDGSTDDEADTFLPKIESDMITTDSVIFDKFIFEIHKRPVAVEI